MGLTTKNSSDSTLSILWRGAHHGIVSVMMDDFSVMFVGIASNRLLFPCG